MGSAQIIYTSVKSYSRRGGLLTRDDLQMLAESRDLDELITRIRNTSYADAMSGIEKPYTSAGIESALRAKLAEIHYAISKTASDSDILDAYYLKFLISNLKIILKGKALGKTQEEIESHVNLRAEELAKRRDTIVKATVSSSLDDAVASLSGTQFGEDASKAASLYGESGSIQAFDAYFDRIIYSQLARSLSKDRDRGVTKLISMDIDFYNILGVIRGKLWGLDEQQIQDILVAPTRSAPQELLQRMAASQSVRDAIAELAGTRYKDIMPQSESELDAVAEFERLFEMAIFEACGRSFTRMFSFATTVAITKLTAFEVRNLASIAYAVEQGLSAESVMPKLITRQE